MYLLDDGIKLNAKLEMPKGNPEKCPICIIVHGFTGHMDEDHLLAVNEGIKEMGIATLRFDLYGHGTSEGEFKYHNLHKWISNVLKAIEYVKSLDFVTDIYLCGHSQGGLTALLVAGMENDTVKATIALAPALVILEGARKGNLLGQPFDPVNIPDYLMSWDGRELSGDYVRVAQTLHIEDSFERYTNPILIVHGKEDEAVPVECSIEAAPHYKNCDLKLIEEEHHCFDRHMDIMVNEVKEFLKKNQ